MPESEVKSAIPYDARPVGNIQLLSLLLAVRAWTNMQSSANTSALYRASLAYWGVSPVIPE